MKLLQSIAFRVVNVVKELGREYFQFSRFQYQLVGIGHFPAKERDEIPSIFDEIILRMGVPKSKVTR